MSFALKEVGFWRHIKEIIVALLPLKPKEEDNKDQIGRIYV